MHPSAELLQRTITVPFQHRVYFTHAVFSADNPLLADLLLPALGKEPAKALLVVDAGVARAFPRLTAEASAYFSRETCPARLVRPPVLIPGGETTKNHRARVDELHELIEEHGICRHSYILALGGGAVLDLVGFASAIAHRGIRHVRLPTTTLGQADGGVGVKNGINAFGKKNFIGTFAPPYAVINDSDFWPSLLPSEKRAGLIEAIKVALIRNAAFFDEMERNAEALAHFEPDAMNRAIRRCAELHVEHIAGSGDPFEFGSARPLDFGHWAAHKLEQLSGFSISHGAAVAMGLSLDTLYSRQRGLLSHDDAERVLTLVQRLGFTLFDPLMLENDTAGTWLLRQGLEEFREHLGGELTITLLKGIGQGIEVHEMDEALLRASLFELRDRFGSHAGGR